MTRSDRASYEAAGVDVDRADAGLRTLKARLYGTWPEATARGAVKLPFGYFANVIEFAGRGLAMSTDGVGTKALIAQALGKYDTIGIDCIAMNVNDLLCVGATPLSFLDVISVEEAKPDLIDQLSIGLATGAQLAGVSIVGGELAQLKDMMKGDPTAPGYAFDLSGTAVGDVPLDRILIGADLSLGDILIGIPSSGIHSNGFTLARKVFREAQVNLHQHIPELGRTLGEELLEPTHIYVAEVLDVLRASIPVKALMHLTGDGFLNLRRVEAEVGFVIDTLPEPPAIFSVIQQAGHIPDSEMFFVYNMGIGFVLVVPESHVDQTLAIIHAHGKVAQRIGYVGEPDPARRVHIPPKGLVSEAKSFRPV